MVHFLKTYWIIYTGFVTCARGHGVGGDCTSMRSWMAVSSVAPRSAAWKSLRCLTQVSVRKRVNSIRWAEPRSGIYSDSMSLNMDSSVGTSGPAGWRKLNGCFVVGVEKGREVEMKASKRSDSPALGRGPWPSALPGPPPTRGSHRLL